MTELEYRSEPDFWSEPECDGYLQERAIDLWWIYGTGPIWESDRQYQAIAEPPTDTATCDMHKTKQKYRHYIINHIYHIDHYSQYNNSLNISPFS